MTDKRIKNRCWKHFFISTQISFKCDDDAEAKLKLKHREEEMKKIKKMREGIHSQVVSHPFDLNSRKNKK